MASPSPPMKPKAHHYTTTTPTTTATTTTATTTANNSSESTSPSPPPSPRRHSNFPQCRRRRLPKRVHSFPRRESFIAGIFLRRGIRYFLLLPLLYLVSGLIMCVGPFSLIMHPRPLPGSVYRSHEIFDKLWDDIRSDNSSAIELSSIWRYKRKLKEQKPCPQKTGGRNFGISVYVGFCVGPLCLANTWLLKLMVGLINRGHRYVIFSLQFITNLVHRHYTTIVTLPAKIQLTYIATNLVHRHCYGMGHDESFFIKDGNPLREEVRVVLFLSGLRAPRAVLTELLLAVCLVPGLPIRLAKLLLLHDRGRHMGYGKEDLYRLLLKLNVNCSRSGMRESYRSAPLTNHSSSNPAVSYVGGNVHVDSIQVRVSTSIYILTRECYCLRCNDLGKDRLQFRVKWLVVMMRGGHCCS
ncbi:hypothetical protein RHGRI_017086 [Rhododendron griersonianum]|uniref:Uncharacterized protein n=1 Tax=Rhododendron griersonianum TaxID=479676 RepID=A0AAV6JWI1_9ERIC|nr:hypothetical protein RHGRI_017086 [Rhododendron griersonianum]